MRVNKLVIIAITILFISGCKNDFTIGGPLYDKIFGHEDSPLVYCHAPVPVSPIVTSGFGFNEKNTRNQPSDINASNVAQLNLKYTVVDEKEEIRRGAPAATEDVLYYTGVDKAYALNRESGCAYWYYEPPKKYGAIRSASVLLVDEPTLNKRIVIIGTRHAEVIALDANTGQPLWNVFAGNQGWLTINGVNKNKSMITGGLQYHDGVVYAPIATHEVADAVLQPVCCKTHGVLTAIDSETGEILWDYQTTAKATMQNGDPTKFGPSGAAIWSTPLVDVARNQVLVSTGQNFTKPLTHNSDAVVALDMTTGKEKWVFKGTPVDFYNSSCGVDNPPFPNCPSPSYDYDMITPILARDNVNNRDIIVSADKGGTVYGLNPVDGAEIWRNKVGEGGLLGGVHWAMAIDDQHVYTGIADFKVPKAAILGSTLADLLEISPSQVPNAKPGIYALRLSDGTVAWQKRPQHSYNGQDYDSIFSAGVSVTNDVLFAGSLDGRIRAFNTANGDELWSDYTAHGVTDVMDRKGNGGAIDSVGPVIAGKHLILNSGYRVFNIGGKNPWQGGPGNAIFVYTLP